MLGLRAGQLLLSHSASSTTVTLFPMVHVGDPGFYEAVYAEALNYDVVLEEGVRSPVSRRITRSYRWIDTARLGLVVQPKLRQSATRETRIVLADLSADEFQAEWRKVPLWLRLAVSVGAPAYGLWQRFFATRESLADRMCLEDRKSPEEILSWSSRMTAFWHSIGDARDARLVSCLAAELDRTSGAAQRIAVVYGARHMRAVLAELVRRGFICTNSNWREVIAL